MKINVRKVTLAAVIAALYAMLTLAFAPLSYGPVQARISEALCILPMFTPVAIPGLFVGCIISNLFSATIYDVIWGSIATLIAAYLTWKLRKNIYLAVIPPIILNGIIVGSMLFMLGYPAELNGAVIGGETAVLGVKLAWLATCLSVAIGEAAVMYVIGIPLHHAIKKPVSVLLDKFFQK